MAEGVQLQPGNVDRYSMPASNVRINLSLIISAFNALTVIMVCPDVFGTVGSLGSSTYLFELDYDPSEGSGS